MASGFASDHGPTTGRTRGSASGPGVEILGGGRVVLWPEARRVEIVSETGPVCAHTDHALFEAAGCVVDAVALDGTTVLLGRRAAGRLHCFDTATGSERTIPCPERLPRAEELRIHAVSGGYLVITENGLLGIDRVGRVRWQVDEVTFGWRLVASTETVYWLEDTSGNVVGLDAGTGAEAGC